MVKRFKLLSKVTKNHNYRCQLLCENFILSEKLWMALVHYMVPVVMGTSLENYKERLPPNSFIHVDNFTGPKELASYVNYLDTNDNAYR